MRVIRHIQIVTYAIITQPWIQDGIGDASLRVFILEITKRRGYSSCPGCLHYSAIRPDDHVRSIYTTTERSRLHEELKKEIL